MLFGRPGRDIVHHYKNDSYMEFIMGNVHPTLYMDLVTFSKNLVVSSSIDDKLLGVRTIDRILRSFAGGKAKRSRRKISAAACSGPHGRELSQNPESHILFT